MHRAAIRLNSGSIPGNLRIDPVVVNVAIEDFAPEARRGKAQPVVPPGALRQGSHHDHVLPRPVEPAMKGENTVFVGRVKCAQIVAAQRGSGIAQANEVLREAEMIGHRPFGSMFHWLSSRNSWPMNSWGIPGAVSRTAAAKRLRLRPYQDCGLAGSASAGMRGLRPVMTRSWFSIQVTARHAWSSLGGYSAAAIADSETAAWAPRDAAPTASRSAPRRVSCCPTSKPAPPWEESAMIGGTVEGMSENFPRQNSAFCRIRGCRVRNSVVSVRQNSQPLP